MIREVRMDEYEQLMELYLHLHETSVPPAELTRPLWERLVNDPDYHLIAAEGGRKAGVDRYLRYRPEPYPRPAPVRMGRKRRHSPGLPGTRISDSLP